MKAKTTRFYLTDSEHGLLIKSLNTLRTKLLNEGRYTDVVDELMLKVMTAPQKKIKIT